MNFNCSNLKNFLTLFPISFLLLHIYCVEEIIDDPLAQFESIIEPAEGAESGGYVFFPESVAKHPDYISDSVVVRFASGADINLILDIVGGRIDRKFVIDGDTFADVRINPSLSVTDALEFLNGVSGIVYAEPNYIYKPSVVPNDPFYSSNQYAPQITETPKAWDIEQGNENVISVIIDTGVDFHQEFRGRMIDGWNFITDTPAAAFQSIDDQGHGTHVAGSSAAQGNDHLGITGGVWNAKIMPLKVCGGRGCPSFAITDAIHFAGVKAKENPDKRYVINMSLGGPFYSQLSADVNQWTIKQNVSILAAAGNDGKYQIGFPAGYSGVIGIGATTSADELVYFSSRGWHVDVSAPGANILSCRANTFTAYVNMSGTSMATPFAHGITCLLRSANPNLMPYEIQEVFEATCDTMMGKEPNRWRSDQGYGRINSGNATELVKNMLDHPNDKLKWTWTDKFGETHIFGTELNPSQKPGFRYGNINVTVKIDKNSIISTSGVKIDVPLTDQDVFLLDENRDEVIYIGRTSDGMSTPKDLSSFGVLPPGELNFIGIPAGTYWLRAVFSNTSASADHEQKIVVVAGQTVTVDMLIPLAVNVYNLMVTAFPIYNNSDIELSLGNPGDSESLTAMRPYLRIFSKPVGLQLSGRNINQDFGSNSTYWNWPKAKAIIKGTEEVVIELSSIQFPGTVIFRPDLDLGYYGLSVTTDLFAPAAFQIDDTFDAMPKADPSVLPGSASSVLYWLDPEATPWLEQKGEFLDSGSGKWIDLNGIPGLSPDKIFPTDTSAGVANMNIVKGYLHLGDRDAWILDLNGI